MAEDMVTALLGAAHEAGQVVMRHRAAGVTAQIKADKSVVTAADQEAEAVILAVLERVAPGVPVVAEEESSAGRQPGCLNHTRSLSLQRWVCQLSCNRSV